MFDCRTCQNDDSCVWSQPSKMCKSSHDPSVTYRLACPKKKIEVGKPIQERPTKKPETWLQSLQTLPIIVDQQTEPPKKEYPLLELTDPVNFQTLFPQVKPISSADHQQTEPPLKIPFGGTPQKENPGIIFQPTLPSVHKPTKPPLNGPLAFTHQTANPFTRPSLMPVVSSHGLSQPLKLYYPPARWLIYPKYHHQTTFQGILPMTSNFRYYHPSRHHLGLWSG